MIVNDLVELLPIYYISHFCFLTKAYRDTLAFIRLKFLH